MVGLKFMFILVLVIVFNDVENCDSFSIKIISNHHHLKRLRSTVSSKQVPTSVSYDVVQDPISHVGESARKAGPDYNSPVPASPSYTPGPSSDPYPAVPTSPEVPAPKFSGQIPPSLMEPIPKPIVVPPESPLQGNLPPLSTIQPPVFAQLPPIYPPLLPPHPPAGGIKAAYWPSFTHFPASSIDNSYFTHIYYAFLLPEPGTFRLNVTPFDETKIPEFINALRTQDPPVKILLSIGGGGNDPTVFAKMVSSEATRAVFIDSTIKVARRYGFDGVDLDWEFPANDQEMSNLALLYSQWREALNLEAETSQSPRLLLTSAVYYSSRFTLNGEQRMYPIEAINNHLDWVSPMCFDYHGLWENFTGVHAALYGDISTSRGIGSWIEDGVRPRKLVMGLPLYGRTWKLKDPGLNGIGAPAVGVGPGGGVLTYSQILQFNNDKRAAARFDPKTVAYYSYWGDSWVGYDGVTSIYLKVIYAKLHGLGGYFFWALGQDQNWTISKQASIAWGR